MLLTKNARSLLFGAMVGVVSLVPGTVAAQDVDKVLPFHSEVSWYRLEQVPVPEGRCSASLSPGLSYLWLTKEYGTATTTHLGTGPYYIEFCVFGMLLYPDADPPMNGSPYGFNSIAQVWTAANGDQLKATGSLLGGTTDPVFTFVDSLVFLDGGTGRFALAEGQGTGFVYPDLTNPQVGREVYDGWIRYTRQ